MDIHSREKIILHCPLDGETEWDFLYLSSWENRKLPIYECTKCKLQRIYPPPASNNEDLYGEDYYSGKADYSYQDERKNYKYQSFVWDARLRNISKYIKSGNFLDIGCSFGGFLSRAEKFGFTPFGVEVSKVSAQVALERGYSVINGTFQQADLPDNFFDVVTMIEVIEHLDEPGLLFSKLYRILKPGGLLVIQTANFEGWQAKNAGENYHYYLPGHLYYYGYKNLKDILARYGFKAHRPYFGVDFPLWAKLAKSRGNFKSIWDYRQWVRISWYHWISKFRFQSRPLTSSMVLYTWKGEKDETS